MMKRLLSVLVLLGVMMAFAPRAHAISAYGTWWNSNGENGFGITLRHRQNITPLFAIDGRAGWVGFSNFNVFPLEATGLVTLGIFYGGPGIGYYFYTGDVDLKSSVGYHGILGASIGLGGLGVYGEAKWGYLRPEYDSGPRQGQELNLDHFAFHAGVVIGI